MWWRVSKKIKKRQQLTQLDLVPNTCLAARITIDHCRQFDRSLVTWLVRWVALLMFQLLNFVSKCKRWPRHGTNHPATDGIPVYGIRQQRKGAKSQQAPSWVICSQFWMKKLESISPTAFFFMDTATTTRWMVQDFCQLPIILQSLHRLICNCTKCLGFSPRAGTTMDG